MKYSQVVSLLVATLQFGTRAFAEGINCEGSSDCLNGVDTLSSLVQIVQDGVTNGSLAQTYTSGRSFASASGNSGAICALFQNGASGTLSDALSFLNQIQSHGCKVCGSVPTNPGNDVSTGELTVNFISTPGGDGVDDDGEFEQFDGDGNDSDNDFGGSTAGLAGGDDGGDVEKRRVSAMFGRRKVFEA